MDKNYLLLTGQTDEHIIAWNHHVNIHQDLLRPLKKFQEMAAKENFELAITSCYRSYERQKQIWNGKVNASIALRDDQGEIIDREKNQLTPKELVFQIMRWSAIPGASRHHWGTDLDIYDKKSVPPNYKVELIPEEVNDEGIFGPFHRWIDNLIYESKENDFPFFRPYHTDTGGISPERWHMSYAPLSKDFEKNYTLEFFKKFVESADFIHNDIILKHSEEIFEKFIKVSS